MRCRRPSLVAPGGRVRTAGQLRELDEGASGPPLRLLSPPPRLALSSPSRTHACPLSYKNKTASTVLFPRLPSGSTRNDAPSCAALTLSQPATKPLPKTFVFLCDIRLSTMVDQKSPAVKICCIGAGYVGGAFRCFGIFFWRAPACQSAHE